MEKLIRKIIKIDEDLCNGCGDCVTSCAEGAIQIIDGKAKLVRDSYCDGLGACIGECPTGALTIEERESEAFDEVAVEQHLGKQQEKQSVEDIVSKVMGHRPGGSHAPEPSHGGSCPGSMSRMLEREPEAAQEASRPSNVPSQLGNWPVQLMLAPVNAPYFNGADILLSADCAPFSYGNFHRDFVRDKVVLIGCPKLDDAGHYQDKLIQIFKLNDVKSVHVLFMEVPCCFSLASLVRNAIDASGNDVDFKYTKIGIRGDVIESAEA